MQFVISWREENAIKDNTMPTNKTVIWTAD